MELQKPVDRRFKSDRPHTFRSRSLDYIAEEVRSCRLCPLADGRTSAVPGEGPSKARVVLIGEAPGREEDLSGRPFVGRGGRLLDSVLESVGVSREAVFITNIVKCRPPRNRPPTRWESETCIDSHLRRQLKAIDPELVVLMGRTATRALLGADSLGEVRGKIVSRGRTKFLSTYHPAAVLRNPRLKSTLAKDLRKIHTT